MQTFIKLNIENQELYYEIYNGKIFLYRAIQNSIGCPYRQIVALSKEEVENEDTAMDILVFEASFKKALANEIRITMLNIAF